MRSDNDLLPKSPEDPRNISKDTYQNFLEATDIKQGDEQHRKRIAVIGAGISGLVAAWLLKRADHDVVVFEANNIVGGRIKTIRDAFTGNLYAEAGAMRIPDTHTLVRWFIDEFGLELCDFENHCESGILYANEERAHFSDYHKKPEELGFDLKPSERGKTASDLFDEALRHYAQLCGHPRFNPKIFTGSTPDDIELFNYLDKHSLREFLYGTPLNKPNYLSRAAAHMICLVMGLEMHLPASMAAILNDYADLNHTEEYYRIKGGMDQLPKAFVQIPAVDSSDEDVDLSFERALGTSPRRKASAPDLAGDVRYNRRVDWIGYGRSETRKRQALKIWNFNTKTGHTRFDDFDLAVMAIPFSAMQSIRLTDRILGPDKRRAIRQLHYDNSCKILLEFSYRFWENHASLPAIRGGKSLTDLLIRQTYYPKTKMPDASKRRAVLLASYTWGDDSLRWTALSRENRIRFATRDLELVHNEDEETLRKALISGTSHSWADDEFTSGAFAMFEPLQKTELFDHIWRPEHLLHFCGEHTSTKQAWMEGAIESGIRVAREVCGRVKTDPQLSPKWAKT